MKQQAFASPGEALATLEHHGVKGMRWGVRKEEVSSPRETTGKAGTIGRASAKTVASGLTAKQQHRVDKFLQRSDILGTKISEVKAANKAFEGSKNPVKIYAWHNNKQVIRQLQKQQEHAEKDAEAVQKGKLTRKQKQVIAGAVAVTAIVGVGLVMRGQQSGALNSWKLLGQARLSGAKVPFKVNEELRGPMSAKDLLEKIAKPVNPGYSKAGGKMNCRRSTYAYELRRRGFDVHATTSSVGYGQSESGVINALTTKGKDYFRATSMSQSVIKTGGSNVARGDKRVAPGAKIILENLRNTEHEANIRRILSKIDRGKPFLGDLPRESRYHSSSKRVLEELAKQPNGARGEVMFKFSTFGHSMAYEIVDGVPHIFDSQKGTLYNASKMVESKWDGFSSAEIRRLDNVDLDLNFLTRWATNVGGK